MEVSKFLRGIFFTLMCSILMSGLYLVLFGNPNGKWEGALFYASRQMEYPISKYYYTYCYLPNVHMEDDISTSLGGTLKTTSTNNINKTESDLSSDDSDNENFSTVPSYYFFNGWYTSGWN